MPEPETNNMTRFDCEAVAVDFETTGPVPGYPNRPWQIGMAPIGGGAIRSGSLFSSLINVGARPFNKYAPGRHAQLRGEIAAAPTMSELCPTILPMLTGKFIVAHNAGTERAALAAAAPLHKFGPWLDTLALARAVWQSPDSYTLEDLCARHNLSAAVSALCPGLAPHDALYDAVACAALFLLIRRQPGWKELSLEELANFNK